MSNIKNINKNHYGTIESSEIQASFLELRFQDGMRTCFNYHELSWFNYDPEIEQIDLEFAEFLISLKGHNLCPELFEGIRERQVYWVKESGQSPVNDGSEEVIIETITITVPNVSDNAAE